MRLRIHENAPRPAGGREGAYAVVSGWGEAATYQYRSSFQGSALLL